MQVKETIGLSQLSKSRRWRKYTWRQLAGAGSLAGIGLTMSLFTARQAFPSAADFSAAKIAVFAASILSAVVGTALLWELRTRSFSKRRPKASIIARRQLCRTVNRSSFDDSTYRCDSSSR
jgi:NhaA family Na+:H+ antiporter